jgi:hypothetical protein
MGMRQTKELDHYLKRIIDLVPDKIQNFIDGNEKSMVYYTGSWAKDIYDNYTEKQSQKIFKTMDKFNDKVMFFQRRNKDIKIGTWSEYGENPPQSIANYDYIVMRKQ